jgi:phospholipid transport system substrate-binding protein
MNRVLKPICILFCCLFFGTFSAASASLDTGPTGQLKLILDDLTAVLSDESLQGDEHREVRRARIMDQIQRGFDFRETSKRMLGTKTWLGIDNKDQDYFTELMTELLENVYIDRLEGYSGQSVEYAGERVKGKRAQVRTFISDKDGKIPVYYMMLLGESRWMIYDINTEGVGLVKNYRQQFKSILKKDKFEGLVKVLEEKNRSFEKDLP